MIQKTFDCVEMKRQGSQKLYEQLNHLTQAEEEQFWKEKNRDFAKRQAELIAKQNVATSTPSELMPRERSV